MVFEVLVRISACIFLATFLIGCASKTCVHCLEDVKPGASVCKHCGNDPYGGRSVKRLEDTLKNPWYKPMGIHLFWWIIGGWVVLSMISSIGKEFSKPSSSEKLEDKEDEEIDEATRQAKYITSLPSSRTGCGDYVLMAVIIILVVVSLWLFISCWTGTGIYKHWQGALRSTS